MPGIASPDLARLKVIRIFLDAAVQLARVSGVGLDELREHLEVAYYEHLRQRNLSIAQIAKRLNKSERTVSVLATRWRAGVPLRNPLFLLRRDVLAKLTEGSVSCNELHESLWRNYSKVVDEAVPFADVVAALVAEGLVRLDGEQLSLAETVTALDASKLETQLVGLRDMLSTATHFAYARFFGKDDPVVRVFSLAATPAQLQGLASEMYEIFLQRLREIDAQREPNAKPSSVFFGAGLRSRELE